MEKPPEWKTVKKTPYGPHLERVRSSDTEPNVSELRPKQRKELKLALAFIGALYPTALNQSEDTSRMPTDTNQPNEPTVAGRTPAPEHTPSGVLRDLAVTESLRPVARPTDSEPTPEVFPGLETELREVPSITYEELLTRYDTEFRLAHDTIQVLNERGQPVGEPISFVDTDFDLPPGTQGPVNEAGIATEGIAGKWLEAARAHVQALHPGEHVVSQVHANELFTRVYDKERFPEIVDRVDSGEIETTEDLAAYFIEQPFTGANEANRYEYAMNEVSFRDEELVIPVENGEIVRRAVPPSVQTVFRDRLPGLIAHESLFRDDLVSENDARGAAQVVPDEWKRVTGESAVDTAYARQVVVWGEIMSDFYNSVYERIDTSTRETLREQFADADAFETELMARLALLAYNAGPRRVGEVVRAYVAVTPTEELPEGADVFAAIVQFGAFATSDVYGEEFTALDAFGPEAGAYVPQVEAKADALHQRFGESSPD